jgi:cytidylate kinase
MWSEIVDECRVHIQNHHCTENWRYSRFYGIECTDLVDRLVLDTGYGFGYTSLTIVLR